jgi:dihydroneopterin aldolase
MKSSLWSGFGPSDLDPPARTAQPVKRAVRPLELASPGDRRGRLNIGTALALLPAMTNRYTLGALPAPSTEAAATAMDLIFIEGFIGETVIGIHESELDRPQPVVIDLHAGVPHARACDTDRIGDTIDYGVVAERLRRLLVEHRHSLLEAFAENIAEILIGEFGARWVRVKVVKPRKFADVDAVGVQIERSAPVAESPRPGHSAAVIQLLASGMLPGKT